MEEYKILIVEDIKAAHLLYEQALTNYNDNYSVKCIDRGKEALKELKYKKYNLIILDIDLPDIRGEEVLEKIREMGINTPVLILTAFGQKSLVINVTEFGIHDYLLKPLDLDVLRDRVNEILLGNKKIVIKGKKSKSIPEIINHKEVEIDEDKKYLWKKKVKCPVCNHEFETYNYKNKSQVLIEKESDFHEVFEKIDPVMYDVYVCTNCYYAEVFQEFEKLSSENIKRLSSGKRQTTSNFKEKRSLEDAIESFNLAIETNDLYEKINESHLANLFLKKAWLYRDLKDYPREKENMQKALELYEKKYLTAKSINGMLSENGLAYLIAELSRRVGDYQKAHNYFKKVLNDKNKKDEKYIYNLAKKQIENLKEEESK